MTNLWQRLCVREFKKDSKYLTGNKSQTLFNGCLRNIVNHDKISKQADMTQNVTACPVKFGQVLQMRRKALRS